MGRQLSSLFKTRAGKRARPLAEVGAVAMALPLVVAGTMQVQPPTILVLLSPMLLVAVLRCSLLRQKSEDILCKELIQTQTHTSMLKHI